MFLGDVYMKRVCANVSDVSIDPRYMPALETKLGSPKARCMICAPIIADGTVLGVVQATNKFFKGRSPRDLSSINSFSANEAMLLGFIATNMALSLKQSSLSHSLSQQVLNGVYEHQRNAEFNSLSKKLLKLDGDHSLNKLIEFAYKTLDAERVSIFTYNASSKNLVCTVSQDIKGFSIPSDKGIVGLSFTAKRMFNVSDTISDSRHNKDVDRSVGFTTRNVLCAPILSQEGVPLGVIQAVNKRGGSNFTNVDEQQIDEVCKQMQDLLKADIGEKQPLPSNNTPVQTVDLVRSIGNMTLSTSLSELVQELQKIVDMFAVFDFVGVYILDRDRLFRLPPLKSIFELSPSQDSADDSMIDQWLLSQLPLQVKQALQFNSTVEYKFNPLDGTNLFPGLELYHGLIMPVNGKAYPFQPGDCVLVIGNTKAEVQLSESIRESLSTVVEFFGKTMSGIGERCYNDENHRTVRQQLNMLTNAIAAIEDYLIVLNEEGNLITSNKGLEALFGLPESTNGSTPVNSMVEGSNYKDWLTAANSPQFCRDIQHAISSGESKDTKAVRFSSPVYPDGISVDYRVTVVENPYHVKSTERVGTPSPDPSPSFKSSDLAESFPNNSIIILCIHVNSRKVISIDQAVPTAQSKKTLIEEFGSATSGVDVATQILSAIRSNFVLDPEVESTLKQIMGTLTMASRRMSISQTSLSAVSLALQAANYPLVNPAVKLPDDIFEWQFNVLPITDSIILCNIIGKFFATLFNVDELGVDSSTLARYIVEVGKHYHERPFHNLQHATCVTHITFMLIKATATLDNLAKHQAFGILVSAVVHDVDHPGNTNLFEVNSGSDLAIRYNDNAVLENHHCSTAFRLMRKPNLNILGRLPKNIAADIRKTIINCVMATDMAVHFELIEETKRRAIDGWNFAEVKDQTLLGKIVLHAADLSNPVRPYHMSRQWAERISLEFNDQVAREQALGMPVLGFMLTPDAKAQCKNETTFASYVVAPMWRALSSLYPNLSFLVEQLDNNLLEWKSRLERLLAEEEQNKQQEVQSTPSSDN